MFEGDDAERRQSRVGLKFTFSQSNACWLCYLLQKSGIPREVDQKAG